jgi:sigma-B regulation protein RsbU (phosphoserine phosphatase)
MTDLAESRILIVDDVKANVDVLVQALRGEYKLSVALSGESALKSAEKQPPDLVLLDIMMPGLDGYEVCRRLRASPATRDVPVMFLSSLDEAANKAQGFEVGGNDYLTKPFSVVEAKARVRSLVKAKAYTDAVKEKIASELRIAREIQMGILPADIAALTAGTGLDIAAALEPAKEVGGDLYEVVRTDDGRVVVVVGDVSGKGIPAALFMAVSTTLLRTMARQFKRPDEIVRAVSDALVAQNPHQMFVTVFCAVFDLNTGTATYASAGHPSPVRLRPGERPALPFGSTGMMAGLFPEVPLDAVPLDARPGDTLVLYSDGVTEAFNEAGAAFGERGLVRELTGAAPGSAAEAVAAVLGAVKRHAGQAPPSDDITILATRLTPEFGAAK